MYRREIKGQQKLELPFGVELRADNRWVKLAGLMPRGYIDEDYSQNFTSADGQVSKPSRLAFGALYIQNRLDITDEETVDQIMENPAMQYFCGYESYSTDKPFDASLMVYFRKRISPEMIKRITEKAFAKEALKTIETEYDDDNNDGDNPGGGEREPKGTLLLDATCCPSDIHYPTDVGLLNHARELTEAAIDDLHGQLVRLGAVKPRTYREIARKAFLAYSRKRKHSKGELRFAIRQQLGYVRH